MDKCFCHLNGYEVKDAKARRCVEGVQSMGNIQVSGITSKNKFNLKSKADWIFSNSKYEVNKNSITVMNNDKMEYSFLEYYIDGLKPNTAYTISFELLNENGQPRLLICSPRNTANTEKVYYDFTSETNGKYTYSFMTGDDTTNLAMILYSLLGAYTENVSVTFSNIQIEEGLVATEYVPYFELATIDDVNEAIENIPTTGGTSESVKGYYYYEMNLQKLLFGLNGNYNNEVTDIECQNVAKEIIEKITSDNVRTPHIIIANSLDTYTDSETGETVEKPAPRQIILSNLTHFTSDGVEHYSFEGIADYNGIVNVDDNDLPILTDVTLNIEGVWNNDTFTLYSLTIGGNMVYLATKNYVDEAIQGIEIPEGSTDGVKQVHCVYFSGVYSISSAVAATTDERETISNIVTETGLGNALCIYVTANGANAGFMASGTVISEGSTIKLYSIYGDYSANPLSKLELHQLSISGTWNEGIFTCSSASLQRKVFMNKSDYLAKNNTTAFTPTANYHPATKKYVDDLVSIIDNNVFTLTVPANETSASAITEITYGAEVLGKGEYKVINAELQDPSGLYYYNQEHIKYHVTEEGKLKITITPVATSDTDRVFTIVITYLK